MKRRGFTLIELVVVIALLALLSALLVMAIGKMQTNGKRQQTRLIMQNLSSMFADYDVNRRVPFGAGSLSPTLITANNLDANYLPMAAPGDVTSGAADRTGTGGNYAVCYTRDFMAQLLSTPNNAASLGKLPPSALMTFVGTSLSGTLAWSSAKYPLYGQATSGGTQYIRSQLYLDPSGTGAVDADVAINAPPNYYYWMPDLTVPTGSTTPLSTPVVLDAWGNPILFVMGGVFGNIPSTGNGTITIGGTKVQPIYSPDYHPFFASAGPDGNFSKADDNLYSFEK